jgi:hypothetical protein
MDLPSPDRCQDIGDGMRDLCSRYPDALGLAMHEQRGRRRQLALPIKRSGSQVEKIGT